MLDWENKLLGIAQIHLWNSGGVLQAATTNPFTLWKTFPTRSETLSLQGLNCKDKSFLNQAFLRPLCQLVNTDWGGCSNLINNDVLLTMTTLTTNESVTTTSCNFQDTLVDKHKSYLKILLNPFSFRFDNLQIHSSGEQYNLAFKVKILVQFLKTALQPCAGTPRTCQRERAKF